MYVSFQGITTQYGYRYAQAGIIMKGRIDGEYYDAISYLSDIVGGWWVPQKPFQFLYIRGVRLMTDYLWIVVAIIYLLVFIHMCKNKVSNPAYTLAGTLLLSITTRVKDEMCMIISSIIVLSALIARVVIILRNRYR